MLPARHNTESLLTFNRLFHLFVAKFSSYTFLHTSYENASTAAHLDLRAYNDEDDLDQCLYYLQTLSNVLRWSSDNTWSTLAHNTISTEKTHQYLYQISECSITSINIQHTLTFI